MDQPTPSAPPQETTESGSANLGTPLADLTTEVIDNSGLHEPEANPTDAPAEPSEPAEPQAPKEDDHQAKLARKLSKANRRADEAEKLANAERAKRLELEEQYGRSPPKEPQYQDFADIESYAKALAQYTADKTRAEEQSKYREEQRQRHSQKMQEQWQQSQKNAKAEYADFEEVVGSASDVNIPNHLAEAILESPYGAHLQYQIALDDTLVDKLVSISPASALREIGKLEARIEREVSAKQEQKSVARKSSPTPITPIRGPSANVVPLVNSKGEFTGTFEEFKQLRASGKL